MTHTFFDQVNKAAQKIARELENARPYKETSVAVRVIGEFSSGKTRFVKELFGNMIPAPLEPVSSTETETLLPLEVVYGEKPVLELIRRGKDHSEPEILERLDKFPDRKWLAARYDENMRLRLRLPEERLILRNGDGYHEGNEPRLLRIIDYPGWNSEDESRGPEALGLSSDWLNLGIVYVCPANRIAYRPSREKLEIFLNALGEELEPATAKTPIFLVITYANEREGQKLANELAAFAGQILKDKQDDFPVLALPVDFAEIREKDLDHFRKVFWHHLEQAGCAIGKPAQKWDAGLPGGDADLVDYLTRCCHWVKDMRARYAEVKQNGAYMGGRSMIFFEGLQGEKLGQKAWAVWKRRAGDRLSPEAIAALSPPDLPKDHYLRAWLDAYWLPRLKELQKRLLFFLEQLKLALLDLNANIKDLEEWLQERVEWHYRRAEISPSFYHLMCTVAKFPRGMDKGRIISTLISLSLMEARFAEN